jgi:hypothetical protein
VRAINKLKRFSVCIVLNHDWVKKPYVELVEDTGHFFRCQRCGKEDHSGGPGKDLRSSWTLGDSG